MIDHNWMQSALAAAMVMMGAALVLELRSVARLRRGLSRDMARIFEQLDLVRFDSQQFAATAPALCESACGPAMPAEQLPIARPVERASSEPYAAALQLAASGAHHNELVTRCGVSRGEARLLVALHGRAGRTTAH